ncbi:MAG: T9SS type A sorting domain-containing protein [Saprospiraceae bacterium]|nr:T9SS type A sorting domain-containing protein [Saprospiraceae bacterium]
MKKTILRSILFSLTFVDLFGSNYLRVGDPKKSWATYQGTIEEASLSVRPKGIYLEYGLYLTFSARGTNVNTSRDTLEVVLNFDLPDGAIVHDSWLWIGKDIVRANILDKWTASSIYEGIVNRRKDPSILFKQTATQYELRVFPMVGNETRKVKITYLMPATWGKTNISAGLPMAILNTSLYAPSFFSIFAFTDTTWTTPDIVNDDVIQFTQETDSIFGDFKRAIIESSKYNSNLKMGFNNPMSKGYYFSKFQKDNEGVYQFAMFPSVILDTRNLTKTAILIDYDISNTSITTKELLNTVKLEMLNKLNEKDSFNLIFSNLSISKYSEKWVNASKANIENAFNSLSNPLSTYSNLPALLGSGIDFIKKNGNDGKIIFISNSDNYGDFQVGNKLIDDLLALMNPKIQIHISDYQSISFPSYYINNFYYYGNDYLYTNLSRITSGSFHRVRNGLSVAEVIDGSFRYIGGAITSFDLHTRMQSGICHSRYNINGDDNIAYLNDPIIQIGKFKGAFPFMVEISGEYNNEVFSQEIAILEKDAAINDSVSKIIWTGQYIKDLESGPQSNTIINEIIYNSINERVLSLYTSFLCLEDTNMICNSCLDESRLVNADDNVIGQDSIIIYPNPFKEKLTIELICANPRSVNKLAIYNITGKLIHQFDISNLVTGKNVLFWDSDLPKSGIYLLVYNNGASSKTIKLMKG